MQDHNQYERWFEFSHVNVNERPGRSSIEAAIRMNWVARDAKNPNSIYFPTQKYSLTVEEAVAKRVMSQAAAEYVMAQHGAHEAAPMAGRVDLGHVDDEKRKALEQAKSATPEGALLKAVQALILNPEGIEPQEALLEALRAFLPKLKKAS